MAALSLSGSRDVRAFVKAFGGSNRYVLDYLVEEVLAHQSPEVEAFLLQTSVLKRLCGPLCDALTSPDPAAPGQHQGQGQARPCSST